MSDLPTAASLTPRRDRSIAARRAARQAKVDREQRILRNVCAGVSVAELAAREGVSHRRMRAVVREILARRTPEPPTEYLALQMTRLNEAMLVAYSAMGGQNLKAVDRVVKITRELDRYHGLAAAVAAREEEEWRWAEVPAQRALRPRRASSRLKMAPQAIEIPGFAAANGGPQADATTEPAAGPEDASRLKMAPQALEIPQSAAANGAPPAAVEGPSEPSEESTAAGEAAARATAETLPEPASVAEPAPQAPPGIVTEPAAEAPPADAAKPKGAANLTFAERFPQPVVAPNGVILPPRSRVVPPQTPGAVPIRCGGVTTWYVQDG